MAVGKRRCLAPLSPTKARAVKIRTEGLPDTAGKSKITDIPLHFPFSGTRFDINENSSIFRPLPTSEVDIMGKKRFVGKEPQTPIV